MTMRRTPKKPKRTSAKRAEHQAVRDRFQSERPSLAALVASGEYSEPVKQSDYLMVLEIAGALQKARRQTGMSLADLARRSGIDKAALSRIENGQNMNPTIGTLETIARAIGARLCFRLELKAS
jgi:ribosome-binding protein aMBF1 (putative translation factor)